MSVFTLLAAIKVESITSMSVHPPLLLVCYRANRFYSLVGGLLMFGVGLLYLISERHLTKPAKVSKNDLAKVKNDGLSRTILGAQVCQDLLDLYCHHKLIVLEVGLVAVAMLVTRSSVSSLQARQGLPLGAQVTGWVVLSMKLLRPC